YPLLHILFDYQNPQRWIAEKIDSLEDDRRVLEARKAEAQYVEDVGGSRPHASAELAHTFRSISVELGTNEQLLRASEPQVRDDELKDPSNPSVREQLARLEDLRRDHRAAEARRRERGG